MEAVLKLPQRSILGNHPAIAAAIVLGIAQPTEAQQRPSPAPSASKPNILMIMADDIGWFNVSAYNNGVMGYRTPNMTASLEKVRCSPTGMPNKVARRDEPLSSPDNHRSVRA